MSKRDDGGPAFPVVGSDQCKDYPGMPLRDYFAAKAMQGLLAADHEYRLEPDHIAELAYAQADAMLEARK